MSGILAAGPAAIAANRVPSSSTTKNAGIKKCGVLTGTIAAASTTTTVTINNATAANVSITAFAASSNNSTANSVHDGLSRFGAPTQNGANVDIVITRGGTAGVAAFSLAYVEYSDVG